MGLMVKVCIVSHIPDVANFGYTLCMSLRTLPPAVSDLFAALDLAIAVPSESNYLDLLHQLTTDYRRSVRSLLHDDAQHLIQRLSHLRFVDPPCSRFEFLAAWHKCAGDLIDASVLDPDNISADTEWQVIFIPPLAVRIGGTAVFADSEDEKAACRSTCARLGNLWYSAMKSLADTPAVILDHLSFVIISDGEQNITPYFPEWVVFLGVNDSGDASRDVLLTLLPGLQRDIESVCVVEADHHQRLHLLKNLLANQPVPNTSFPSDFSVD